MVEVGARGPVAVPVVVVEEVAAGVRGAVVQVDAGPLVLRGFVRGRVGFGGDEEEMRGAVRGVGGVVVRVGGGVAVVVGDEAVFGALGGGGLLVVGVVARAAVPGTDADVRLAVGEGADELLEQRMVFDRAHALDVALTVGEDGALERFLGLMVGFAPGRAEILH